LSNVLDMLNRATRPIRGVAKAAVFVLKLFPMIPSRPVDWVTPSPAVEKVKYPTHDGEAEGDVYRPLTGGPFPGIVVCLGVVPFGVDHPQVPILGKALARAGFAALLYWSPAMRDFRMDPEDVENIALAYHWLISQPYVDAKRSGLLGTCVGGAFALMGAASPLVREQAAFVAAYAPLGSMWTLGRDIASGTRSAGEGREPWKVDQLTRSVFVHSLTAWLETSEAERLWSAFEAEGGHFDGGALSAEGQLVYAVLTARDADEADRALHALPASLQERLTAMSPVNYVHDVHAPLVVILHDRGDNVIPVGESRRLIEAFGGRAGVNFTEMQFSHLDPSKGRLPLYRLVAQFGKFFLAVLPLFEKTIPARGG